MNMESGSNVSTYVLSGLAILGIALGSAGLYVGLASHNLETKRDDRLSAVEQRADRLNGATEELQAQIRSMYSSMRSQFEGLANEMTALREDLATKPEPAQTPAVAPAPESAPASAKTYTIRPGDLLGKVAKNNGTTVDTLLKLNPGLSPNRLKVGQTINLP